jgi:hypothetical protein
MAVTGIGSVIGLLRSFVPGSRLVDGGDCLQLAKIIASGQTGLVAKAGGGAAGTAVLPASFNEVSTVVTAADSVALPPALAGLEITVINSGANSLQVFTSQNASAGQVVDSLINLAGADSTVAGLAVAANAIGKFVCARLGVWKSEIQ